MPIARTTVAGATAVASQLKKNLILKLKGSSDYKEFRCFHGSQFHQRREEQLQDWAWRAHQLHPYIKISRTMHQEKPH